jgi:hypothetical protein
MKQLITTAVLLISMTAFAQVGINNTSPKATLDITAKTNGTKPEGLIIPQLTGDQIRAATTATPTPVYGSNQKGLMIYATVADSAPAGATANITAPGYYYFDGSIWQKIATGNTPNLYNTDGALTGTRTVNTAGNPLKISGGGLLVVQTADNSGKIRLVPSDASHTGYMEVIKGDNTRLGYIGWNDTNLEYYSENGASHVFGGGNVGIRTLTPEAYLDVASAGTAFTKNAILSRPASGMDSNFILKTSTGNTTSNPGDITNTFGQAYGANGSLSEGFEFMRGTANSDGSLAIKTAGTERLRIDNNGNVGIGTTSPSAKLEINSSTSGAIKIVDGTQGAGKVLTSDANGVATWQATAPSTIINSTWLINNYTASTNNSIPVGKFTSIAKLTLPSAGTYSVYIAGDYGFTNQGTCSQGAVQLLVTQNQFTNSPDLNGGIAVPGTWNTLYNAIQNSMGSFTLTNSFIISVNGTTDLYLTLNPSLLGSCTAGTSPALQRWGNVSESPAYGGLSSGLAIDVFRAFKL